MPYVILFSLSFDAEHQSSHNAGDWSQAEGRGMGGRRNQLSTTVHWIPPDRQTGHRKLRQHMLYEQCGTGTFYVRQVGGKCDVSSSWVFRLFSGEHNYPCLQIYATNLLYDFENQLICWKVIAVYDYFKVFMRQWWKYVTSTYIFIFLYW